MKNLLLSIYSLYMLGCAGTPSHYGRTPDFLGISIGSSKAQVLAHLGKPDTINATQEKMSLIYTSTPWHDHNGADGGGRDYFVDLVDDRVVAYGKAQLTDSDIADKMMKSRATDRFIGILDGPPTVNHNVRIQRGY